MKSGETSSFLKYRSINVNATTGYSYCLRGVDSKQKSFPLPNGPHYKEFVEQVYFHSDQVRKFEYNNSILLFILPISESFETVMKNFQTAKEVWFIGFIIFSIALLKYLKRT